jgi:peroxiredoxin
MLQIGDPIPDVRVWVTTRERVPLRDLTERRPLLVLTFLFAWSGT